MACGCARCGQHPDLRQAAHAVPGIARVSIHEENTGPPPWGYREWVADWKFHAPISVIRPSTAVLSCAMTVDSNSRYRGTQTVDLNTNKAHSAASTGAFLLNELQREAVRTVAADIVCLQE